MLNFPINSVKKILRLITNGPLAVECLSMSVCLEKTVYPQNLRPGYVGLSRDQGTESLRSNRLKIDGKTDPRFRRNKTDKFVFPIFLMPYGCLVSIYNKWCNLLAAM